MRTTISFQLRILTIPFERKLIGDSIKCWVVMTIQHAAKFRYFNQVQGRNFRRLQHTYKFCKITLILIKMVRNSIHYNRRKAKPGRQNFHHCYLQEWISCSFTLMHNLVLQNLRAASDGYKIFKSE